MCRHSSCQCRLQQVHVATHAAAAITTAAAGGSKEREAASLAAGLFRLLLLDTLSSDWPDHTRAAC